MGGPGRTLEGRLSAQGEDTGPEAQLWSAEQELPGFQESGLHSALPAWLERKTWREGGRVVSIRSLPALSPYDPILGAWGPSVHLPGTPSRTGEGLRV